MDSSAANCDVLSNLDIRAIKALLRHGSSVAAQAGLVQSSVRSDSVATQSKNTFSTDSKLVSRRMTEILAECRGYCSPRTGPLEARIVSSSLGTALTHLDLTHEKLLKGAYSLMCLHRILGSVNNPLSWRPNITTSPHLLNWNSEWTDLDDVKLLVGVWRHGLDDWESIHYDEDLGFESKFRLQSTSSPNKSSIQNRATYLLKLVMDSYISSHHLHGISKDCQKFDSASSGVVQPAGATGIRPLASSRDLC